MKRIFVLAVIVAVMFGVIGCSAKSEALMVPTLAEHNALVDVVNQHKAVLDNIQARIDQLKEQLDDFVVIHDANAELLNDFIVIHDENVEVYNAAIAELTEKVNEIIAFLNE